jgi:hypothetical protein
MRFEVAPVLLDTIVFNPGAPRPHAPPPTTAGLEGTGLVVRGYYETPCAGDRVKGYARRQGDAIRVLVTSERSSSNCAFRTDPYTYAAMLDGIGGTTHIVVEHRRDGNRPDGVVLDTSLTAPTRP